MICLSTEEFDREGDPPSLFWVAYVSPGEPEWGLEGVCVITGSGSQLGVTSDDADRLSKLMTTCLQRE